ncbi:hypothetical protein [Bifidobacterium bifidum]|uniref:hypothetical protein n=1 Tax=Bifidobacterium bifidum TaxID=1681 RepID=UPI0022E1822C|nr:hypothetical protein [Bifidobacterium bifidum]
MIHEDRWKSTSEALDKLADERHGKDDDKRHGKLRERLDGAGRIATPRRTEA